VHKETVPTSEVVNGNYSPSGNVTRYDDAGNIATGPADSHIPGGY
jgi:hypothetical protein